MKSAKWLWGGIGLQLATGYSVAYFVYTIGTLITSPASLKIIPAICGLIAVLAFAAFILVLIKKADAKQKIKTKG